MKILLACSAGMSTSLLVNNMKKVAHPADVIEARPVRTVPDIIDDWDVLLLGSRSVTWKRNTSPCAKARARASASFPCRPMAAWMARLAWSWPATLLPPPGSNYNRGGEQA